MAPQNFSAGPLSAIGIMATVYLAASLMTSAKFSCASHSLLKTTLVFSLSRILNTVRDTWRRLAARTAGGVTDPPGKVAQNNDHMVSQFLKFEAYVTQHVPGVNRCGTDPAPVSRSAGCLWPRSFLQFLFRDNFHCVVPDNFKLPLYVQHNKPPYFPVYGSCVNSHSFYDTKWRFAKWFHVSPWFLRIYRYL